MLIDEAGKCGFLLNILKQNYKIHIANSEIEELHVKYLIERESPSEQKYLIYTQTAKSKLKFIREYCEINGCLEIRYLHNYIKDKIYRTLNINIKLADDELVAAAKVSVGKEQTYWLDLCHKGSSTIFDLRKELLPFINDPDAFETGRYDSQLREMFYRKINELLKQEYITKPAKTLAEEVVKAMFDGLASGNSSAMLKSVYQDWIDSVSYKNSLNNYLSNYKLPNTIDVWSVDPAHPFRAIDERWLNIIGENIADKPALTEMLKKVKKRHESRAAQLLGITFWNDVLTLVEFDAKDIVYLSSFAECVKFYTTYFYKLDQAVRKLYTEFLNHRELLEPFQEYYREQIAVFLDKWFSCFEEYKENQTGILQTIIDDNNMKTAVIVGDGVAYEVARQIADRVDKKFKFTEKIIITDIPSETENNMSRIYMDNGITEKTQSNREKYLAGKNPDVSIDFINLDDVNGAARASQFLICTYKDIDYMGEKLQQKALKYFDESINFFALKVSLLLNSGYSKVYLISDHGFVLTGLLAESDKISLDIAGVKEKNERYIRTADQQTTLNKSFIEIKKNSREFNYLYFAQNMNPFKTPSVYGFSHGGATPQEIITPYFCWEQSSSVESLTVMIANKTELQSVTGELFALTLKTTNSPDPLFSQTRKVCLIFFSNNVQINKSDEFVIKQGQTVTKEYTFDGHKEIEVQLLDTKTKAQLDRATIKQNSARDLGGLL